MGAVVLVGGMVLFYLFWFAGGSGEPSTELTTPELTGTSTLPEDPGPSTTAPGTDPAALVFVIDPEQSTASFEIDEILNGSPNLVVGTTNQVAGQVRVNETDLSTAQFSDIVVNARTLTTDSERRDRAMRSPVILDSGSDANELITFSVTSADGLEGSAQTGDTVEFTITGDLTIKGSTQPVTFDATVTFVDLGTIEGTATAQVSRDAFAIGIPSVPSVADVSDEVLIGLEFVAAVG